MQHDMPALVDTACTYSSKPLGRLRSSPFVSPVASISPGRMLWPKKKTKNLQLRQASSTRHSGMHSHGTAPHMPSQSSVENRFSCETLLRDEETLAHDSAGALTLAHDTAEEETRALTQGAGDAYDETLALGEETRGGNETVTVHIPQSDADSHPFDGGKAKKRARVTALLLQGKDPIEVLESMPVWSTVEFWVVVHHLAGHRRFGEALQAFDWWKAQEKYRPREQHYTTFIRMLGIAKRPDISQQLFDEMKALGLQPGLVTYAALLQSYAESGFFDRAQELLRHMFESSIRPNAATYNGLIHAYGKQGHYDDMNRIFNNMKRWGCPPDFQTYSCMIVAYAKAGLFRRMERMWREMDFNGWKPDYATINAIIQGYAAHGLVKQMHGSYLYVKDYRVLVSRSTIIAMATVYIRSSKFHQLRLFLKDIGLKRNNVGNLLWNLLLLSFAANFQMKNLQRGFQEMEVAGFSYDITTFNIRSLGFSRMQMFWDLHVTLIYMHKAGVAPDLVTFGAVVDAYISGRARFHKMFEELDELQMKELRPDVRTDPLVFEAFGKGDFQSSSEMLMLTNPKPYGSNWTYGLLMSFYLRKRSVKRIPERSDDMQENRFVAKKFVF